VESRIISISRPLETMRVLTRTSLEDLTVLYGRASVLGLAQATAVPTTVLIHGNGSTLLVWEGVLNRNALRDFEDALALEFE